MGFVEISRPRSEPKAQTSAHSVQRRRKLKELLVTQLAKKFGAAADPTVRAVIVAEADRALAKGQVAAEDIRELERNIQKTINLGRTGTFEGPKRQVDAGYVGEKIDWGAIYEYKLVHGDQAERAKLQREKDARAMLNAQIKHQISDKEAARRRLDAEEAAYARSVRADLERRKAAEDDKAAQMKARIHHEVELNKEHVRLIERRREEEAHLTKLEDERMLTEMRVAAESARVEKNRRAVEKAKRLEFAKLQNQRSLRLKAEQRDKEDAEQQRLDAVWKEILDGQERKREEGLKRMFEKQVQRADAYGKSTGAEMAERARKDELNMLHWQKLYAEEQEARCALYSRRRAACPRVPARCDAL
jgi:hypothetical protein